MMIEWLTKRVTTEEAETAHMVKDERIGTDPVPFGFSNAEWRELLTQMQEGDELWEFNSPPKTWANRYGCAGYALVRRGTIVDCLITLRN